MNTFGQLFRLTDFGETHGAGLGGVIDGCPAGIVWDQSFIQSEVDRRSPFYNNFHGTTRAESDPIEFISGIYDNKTTGAPIGFVIPNHDVKPNIETNHLLKPSHSSFVYKEKYGHTCNEQGGRASARQTCCRVVGGAVAKLFLRDYHIEVQTKSISQASLKSGDTSGAIVECVVHNMPSGIGEPVYGGLDAYLAAAMLSIPACKGIEFGAGFRAAQMNGSQYNDLQNSDFTFQTNHDGGNIGVVGQFDKLLEISSYESPKPEEYDMSDLNETEKT